MTVPLTNFTALVKADVLLDDGAESRREFEIEAKLKGQSATFTVPAVQFPSMNWAGSHLGAEAIIYPGQMLREHARCAVQMLSKGIQKRTLFTHTGWRKLGGEWLYLHAGGAIGKKGLVEGFNVSINRALSGYALPAPPSGEDLKAAIREDLKFLDLAPDTVTVPLLSSVYRAVLGGCDFSVHLAGPSGAGKTELAALAQQHFGAAMNARRLPGSWSSTANALEGMAFEAKDALLVIDDFAPSGSLHDTQRYHREADRILRAQGNQSGRQRMRADGSLKEPRPPRGLILSTGEDIPHGKSLRARMVTVEVEPGAVKWELMGACQRAAGEGIYAKCLSTFLQWLSRGYEDRLVGMWSAAERLRSEILSMADAHKRSVGNLAQLLSGFEVFLHFMEDSEAIDAPSAFSLRARARKAMESLAQEQHLHQEAEEPTLRYFELLASAITSGRAHVASTDGSQPENARAWGWKQIAVSDSFPKWQPQGELVGWLGEEAGRKPEEQDLFLEPEAAYAVAQKVGRDTGELIGLTSQTLQKRLKERNLLLRSEDGRATTRVSLQGRQRRVLHLRAESL